MSTPLTSPPLLLFFSVLSFQLPPPLPFFPAMNTGTSIASMSPTQPTLSTQTRSSSTSTVGPLLQG